MSDPQDPPTEPNDGAPGVTFASFQPLGAGAGLEVAALAAELGFGSFWTAETVGQEAFATLAAVATTAPGLALGTGVLALQLRTPMLAAMGAATLQSLAPERAVLLGVGISSPVVVGRWHGAEYGDRPLAQTREYLELTRAALSGEPVDHDGALYRSNRFRLGVRLGDRRPKLVLGALERADARPGRRARRRRAAELPPGDAVPWCIEQVRAGEAAAGRPRGSCTVYAYVHVGVCDPEGARDAARRDLFSYAVVPAYARAFARAGFADEVDGVRRRTRRGTGRARWQRSRTG